MTIFCLQVWKRVLALCVSGGCFVSLSWAALVGQQAEPIVGACFDPTVQVSVGTGQEVIPGFEEARLAPFSFEDGVPDQENKDTDSIQGQGTMLAIGGN